MVGAAAGGTYTAWRAAAAGRKVCVFERNNRPGGRIHSLRNLGPKGDLVVEPGAYRFALHPVVVPRGNTTWHVATPMTTAIVQELNLSYGIYNPNASEWDHGMRKLVDARGQPVGFISLPENMVHRAEQSGASIRYNSEVVGLGLLGTDPADGFVLRLKSGEQVAAAHVLLNLPQRPLIELLRRSGGEVSKHFPNKLYGAAAYPLMKFYVHYDDAWWMNDLGLASGVFYNSQPPLPFGGEPAPEETPAPLQGMYHDGDVRCDLPGGRCRGFIQAFYGSDQPNNPDGAYEAIKFYQNYVDSVREEPHVLVTPEAPHHLDLLERAHQALVDLHRARLDAVNATARVEAMRPTQAVLSIWNEGVQGFHAACHCPKRSDESQLDFTKAALQPFPGWSVFVANEAYGTVNCFAEGSLVMAEMALQKLGVPVPPHGPLASHLGGSWDAEPPAGFRAAPTDPWLMAAGPEARIQQVTASGATVTVI